MSKQTLHYQPVIYHDGTVAIHETIVEANGTIKSATHEPVILQAATFGELDALLRQVYRHIQKCKPINEEELEVLIYGASPEDDLDPDDNVINLVDYFAKQ